MSSVTTDTDVILDIIKTVSAGPIVGALSRYSSVPHPASGKTIDGFLWDKRKWPSALETAAIAYAPSIFDANTNFVEMTDFQSGIGNGNDGLVLSVDERIIKNRDLWVPKINHGYFYVYDKEYYAFSDDVQIQYFYKDVLLSGMQSLTLKYLPKPTIPIEVRQYRFDRDLGEYIPSLDFRKVLEFTGSGHATPEFKVNYDTNQVLLNSDYAEDFCPPVIVPSTGRTDPSTVEALDFLGISDGLSTQYSTTFSPIDADGVMEIWVYSNTASGLMWNEVAPLTPFTPGGSLQYKVDRELGLIFFDDQGNGFIPPLGTSVAARYTKGVAAYYEPINSRDFILASTANTNPLNNPNEKGFITVATTNPAATSISLAADLPGVPDLNYLLNIGNTTATIIATVYDATGKPLEGQLVQFNIDEPQYGNFGTAGLSVSALSKSDGKAKAFYNPPTTIDAFGAATEDVTHSGSTTIIRVRGLTSPTDVSKVFLYQVQQSDEVLGIDINTLDGYYQNFLINEDLQGPPLLESTSVPSTNLFAENIATGGDTNGDLTGFFGQQISGGFGGPTGATTLSIDTSDAWEGTTSVRVNAHLDFSDGSIGVLVDVLPSTTYTASLYAKLVSPEAAAGHLQVFMDDGVGDATGSSVGLSAFSWNRYTVTFTTGPSSSMAQINFAEFFGSTYTFRVDGFQLELGSSATTWVLPVVSSGPPDYTDAIAYEKTHRKADSLLVPITYDPTDTTTYGVGAKKIVLTRSNDVVNPDTGLLDANMLAPLQPVSATDVGLLGNPILEITYSGLLALPGQDSVRSYFVAAFAKTYIHASVLNANTHRRVVSNSIGINLQVPEEANGTYFANTLNAVSDALLRSTFNIDQISDGDIIAFSGQFHDTWLDERIFISGQFESYMQWFRKTRRGDSQTLGLSGVIYAGPQTSRLPLGFRLQNNGITVASLLDQVTYFDPNDHLPDLYFSGIT